MYSDFNLRYSSLKWLVLYSFDPSIFLLPWGLLPDLEAAAWSAAAFAAFIFSRSSIVSRPLTEALPADFAADWAAFPFGW